MGENSLTFYLEESLKLKLAMCYASMCPPNSLLYQK